MSIIVSEQKYIKELIDRGIAVIVSTELCSGFSDYISQNYSWQFTGYRIDWRKHTSCQRFYWIENSDEKTTLFLESTCLSIYSKICMVYGANQPGIMVEFDYAKYNIDVLVCHCPGTSFLVAVENNKLVEKATKLISSCFVEVDSSLWLTSSTCQPK
jgi:hypothetical protein